MKGLGVAIMAAPTARKRQPIYICEMMERLSIEPGGGVAPSLGLSYATAFHRCEACPSKQACRDWLDSMPASVAFAPRFCPNADIFFELQVDQPSVWTNNSSSRGRLSRHKTDDLAQCRRVLSRDTVGDLAGFSRMRMGRWRISMTSL
jgi:hypothetical protein